MSPLVGDDFRISAPAATSYEWDPVVAYNSTNDQYLAVWQDGRNEGSRGNDIYGQLIAADGTRIGRNFRISGPAATSDEWFPAVAYNSTSNQYLVVWQDGRNDATRGKDIYGRRVNASGKLAGGDFRISGPAATSDEWFPAVAYNSTSHQYLVVWYDGRDDATRKTDVYGRRVEATGSPAGGDFRISGAAATSYESRPVVAYNPADNQYLVVWQDRRNWATRGWDIYGRRVEAGGKLAGGDFRISGAAATSDEWNPAVAHNPVNNQYLVVWHDGRNDATRKDDIFGRRVKAGGKLAGGDVRISGAAATSDEWNPAVVHNPASNQYLVVWLDGRNIGTRGWDIFGRRVKATGKLAGGDFRISGPAATSDEYEPAVAYNPSSSQHLVVWEDRRNDATRGTDIYGQRLAG